MSRPELPVTKFDRSNRHYAVVKHREAEILSTLAHNIGRFVTARYVSKHSGVSLAHTRRILAKFNNLGLVKTEHATSRSLYCLNEHHGMWPTVQKMLLWERSGV